MDLDLVFLGTSGSMPTARRAPSALLVRRGGDRLLIDCAEGTQRQLMRSSIGLPELTEVFLTHYHADHYLGLPGMLKTFALRGRELPITIYGPRGLRDLFAALRRIFGKLTYPYELVELQSGDVLDRGDYRVATFGVTHGVPALGYALVEETRPGRFDIKRAEALGIGAGADRGRLQAGETIALPDGTVVRPDGGRRPARPRGDVLRRRARAGARDTALDRARGGPGRGGGRSPNARAHTPLLPLLRPRGRERGARGLSRDGHSARLRRDRDPLRGARCTTARQGRSTPARSAAGRVTVRAGMTRMVQLAVAGDITEAEELQEILSSAGIESQLESAQDEPLTVMVPESSLDDAKDAIEALTEPDDIVAE